MSKMKVPGYAFPIVAAIVIALEIVFIKPHYAMGGDGLNKVIQGVSLRENGYSSEEILYPGRFLDPDFKYYPFQGVYLITAPDGRHLGQYPVFFSFFLAFVSHFLPLPDGAIFLSGLAALLSFFLLRYWKISSSAQYLALFATYVTLMPLDLSESIFSFALFFAGLTVLYSGLEESQRKPSVFFAGGMIAGVSVWLRLEGIIYLGALGLAWLVQERKKLLRKDPYLFWFLGFGLVTLVFLFFNYWDYGNILGPRYMANKGGFYSGIHDRFAQFQILLFGGKTKLGFFGFTPFLLIPLILYLLPDRRAQLSSRDQILHTATIVFLILSAIVAPNDGVVTWGPRYLSYAIFPSVMLVDRFRDSIPEREFPVIIKLAYGISYVWSIGALLVGLVFLNTAVKQIGTFQRDYASQNANFALFDSSTLISQTGIEYFKKPIFWIREPDQMPFLADRIAKEASGKTVAYYALRLDGRLGAHLGPGVLAERNEKTEKIRSYLRTVYEELGQKDGFGYRVFMYKVK